MALLCAAAVFSCSREFAQEAPGAPAPVRMRHISLKLSDEAASDVEAVLAGGGDVSELLGLRSTDCLSVRRMYPDAGEMESRHRAAGLHNWYSIIVPETSVTRVKSGLSQVDGVSDVSVQPRVRLCSEIPFNDELAYVQWGLSNTGSIRGYVEGAFTPGIDINVVPVWEKYTTGSPDVTVAVVDGGVYTHPDLKPVLIPGGENGSRNFVDKYSDTPYLIVPEIHATSVASVIASVNNNGEWFCGVAGGSDGNGGVRIMNCQILSTDDYDEDKTYSTDDIGQAIVWAADHGAVICNNSWGFDYEEGEPVPETTPEYISAAIDYFCDNAGIGLDGSQTGPMRGGLVVFAAGNENCGASQPAMYDRVVAVGAIGPRGERADYSNYGDWVDICAPGGNKDGYLDALGDKAKYAMIAAPGTDEENYYLTEGTSMACPYVSGVAALMVSYFGGEGFTASKLREMLLRGADFSLSEDRDHYIGPMLDALGAFTAGCAAPAKPENISVKSAGSSLVFSWRVTGTGSEPTYACKVQVSRTPDFASPSEKIFVTAGYGLSEQVSFEFKGLDYNTVYYARLYGMGVDRNELTEPSEVFKVSTGANLPPEYTSVLPDVILDGQGAFSEIDLDRYFIDPAGEKLTYSVFLSDERPVEAVVDKNILSLTYKDYGLATITVTAYDYAGNRVSGSLRSLSRESSSHAFDLYPVPVTGVLNVRPGEPGMTEFRVVITSLSGSTVFDSLMQGSAFAPALIDMSNCGPGVYNVRVESDGRPPYAKSIVKI